MYLLFTYYLSAYLLPVCYGPTLNVVYFVYITVTVVTLAVSAMSGFSLSYITIHIMVSDFNWLYIQGWNIAYMYVLYYNMLFTYIYIMLISLRVY